MVKKVVITKTAAKKIKEIAEYLETEYTFHSAEIFVDNTYEAIEKVQKHPTRGRKANASETVRFIT
jgi:plasmid stabilization system protein ParE